MDTFLAQLGTGTGFASEAIAHFGVQQGMGQKLDRNHTAQYNILGPVDPSHSPFTHQFNQVVALIE
jgi:hypothetical protein